MPSNQDLIRRADLAISDLNTNGGLLEPEQANTFIDLIAEEPTILKQSRFIRMNRPQVKLNKIGFAGRIMRAAPQGTPPYAEDNGTNDRYLLAADRSAPVTQQILLESDEVMAEIHIPYEVFEDNIEEQNLETHIMRLIAQQVAIDLEEWALFADTVSGDAYLALQDGWLKRMTSHVVNNANAGVSPTMFQAGLLAMPQKYLRNAAALKHYVSVANTIRYRGLVAQRATGYGDSMLTQAMPIFAFGVPVEAAPMLAAQGTGNIGFSTFPKNLIFGIRRDMSIETERDIRGRLWIVVITMRIGAQVDTEDALVKFINI